mmetsp:Transcript_30284/g.22493  ORF Transcript_30284/g.22493 Transcript_30284/m.22493 type:complete len:149 (-) Transcript_30284:4-450(-)
MKMARRSNENFQNQSSAPLLSEIQELKFQNAQCTTKLYTTEMNLRKREQEIVEQRSLNQHLLEELHKRGSEREAILEENRVLKKGIAIQENKLKEMIHQLRVYEEFITAAKAYIEEAEREKQLKNQQQNSMAFSRSDFFPPQPPPDVF